MCDHARRVHTLVSVPKGPGVPIHRIPPGAQKPSEPLSPALSPLPPLFPPLPTVSFCNGSMIRLLRRNGTVRVFQLGPAQLQSERGSVRTPSHAIPTPCCVLLFTLSFSPPYFFCSSHCCFCFGSYFCYFFRSRALFRCWNHYISSSSLYLRSIYFFSFYRATPAPISLFVFVSHYLSFSLSSSLSPSVLPLPRLTSIPK